MFDTPDTSYSDSDTIDTTVSAPPVAISLVVSPEAAMVLSGLYSSERSFPCSGRTELFFAPPGERRVRREKREATALSYCNQCSAKEMCKLAGRAGREHGMWGGENDEERATAGYAPMFPHRKAIVRAAQDAKRHQALSA
ncbi:MAG: hypothetical protein ACI9TF_001052 [Paracrocinitomix sp.]|jgi:hypothetical protein|tara:strand:- start:231 stop:650 length:420 start_codon:yes stop_codon:yes gene_type:complete